MRWDDPQLLRLIDELESSENLGPLMSGYNLIARLGFLEAWALRSVCIDELPSVPGPGALARRRSTLLNKGRPTKAVVMPLGEARSP